MLNPSRLYSFIDRKNGFAVHFLEGQKLIYDLILTQSKAFESFSYFRSTILSFLPMITFLKNGESLGIYLDSENPYFRFKMETNFAGHTRTLLLPEEFSFIPQKITGQARVTKQFQNQAPYTSIVEFSETASSQISNIILTESYQTQSVVNVSQVSDQSILIIKLPPIEINKIPVVESLSLIEYQEKFKSDLEHVFNKGFNEVEPIVQAFEKYGISLFN
jgi:molecular chaperone Hsp33